MSVVLIEGNEHGDANSADSQRRGPWVHLGGCPGRYSCEPVHHRQLWGVAAPGTIVCSPKVLTKSDQGFGADLPEIFHRLDAKGGCGLQQLPVCRTHSGGIDLHHGQSHDRTLEWCPLVACRVDGGSSEGKG